MRLTGRPDGFDYWTPAEINAAIDAHLWHEEQEMQKLAWLAWHMLLPWRKKGDRSKPADLLSKPGDAEAKPKEPITKEEARARLAELEAEFGVEE